MTALMRSAAASVSRMTWGLGWEAAIAFPPRTEPWWTGNNFSNASDLIALFI
jgi:hypothetical protein